MNLTMSMFANAEEYWKARSYLSEQIVADVVKELGCELDNEEILMKIHELKTDAALGRAVLAMPEGAGLYHMQPEVSGDGWCAKERDFANRGTTPKAALMAAGLMEEEK